MDRITTEDIKKAAENLMTRPDKIDYSVTDELVAHFSNLLKYGGLVKVTYCEYCRFNDQHGHCDALYDENGNKIEIQPDYFCWFGGREEV